MFNGITNAFRAEMCAMNARVLPLEKRMEQLEGETKLLKETLLRVSACEAETYAEIKMHLMEHALRRNPLYRLRRLDERWLQP